MKGAVAIRQVVGTPITNNAASTTIASATYTQLSASLPESCSAVYVANTTQKHIKLAVGDASSEVDIGLVIPAGEQGVYFPLEIRHGVRLSAKALDADATTGWLIINFFQ